MDNLEVNKLTASIMKSAEKIKLTFMEGYYCSRDMAIMFLS